MLKKLHLKGLEYIPQKQWDYAEAYSIIRKLLLQVGFKEPGEWFIAQVYNIIHQPLHESKSKSKKSEQKDFWHFIKDKRGEGWRLDPEGKIPLVPIEVISFQSNSRKYRFKVDERILTIFSSVLGVLKNTLRSESTNSKRIFLKNHSFYEIVSELKSLVKDQSRGAKLKLTDRQNNILAYNLLSLTYHSYFPSENPNEPKPDTDQNKYSHMRSILKGK